MQIEREKNKGKNCNCKYSPNKTLFDDFSLVEKKHGNSPHMDRNEQELVLFLYGAHEITQVPWKLLSILNTLPATYNKLMHAINLYKIKNFRKFYI